MSRIAFFCIPAWGHTNPTVEVVRELTRRGHAVRYYSFLPFQEKLEDAGAEFVACDAFLPPAPPDLERKMGKDFAALIEMVADTTIRMDETVCTQLRSFSPDVIVSDSVCFWGKLFAGKLGVPYVCSTTTFAFNEHTAGLLKQGPAEILRMLTGMPRINRKMAVLRQAGYPIKDFISIIQNDNATDTVVYTSRTFQPMAETFSERYAFVGPSVAAHPRRGERAARPLVYISLGTVMNRRPEFFRSCVEAFRDGGREVLLSVGEGVTLAELGNLPENVHAQPRVDQMEVLRRADVFVTHCGMNSANEAIACGVPTVLVPQQSEERLVAARMEELGVGLRLKKETAPAIRQAVETVLAEDSYRKNTETLAESFRSTGGAGGAADKILQVCGSQRM